LRIALLGDLMLGRSVSDAIAAHGPAYVWGDTLPVLESADLRIANLECAISERGSPQRKRFTFRAPLAAARALAAGGIDCVSLANNHAFDYGAEALADTLRALDEVHIAHAGAGMHLNEAMKPAFLERGGLRVAVVALTDNMPSWAAGAGRAGVHHVPLWSMPERVHALRRRPLLGPLLDAASELRARLRSRRIHAQLRRMLAPALAADLVVLSCHAGPNFCERPRPAFQRFARAALRDGAHVLHGHSAHLVQGIERIAGRPALYDTGDFVDDYRVRRQRNDRSFLFLLDVDAAAKRATRVTAVPIVIERCQARLAPEPLAAEICERMARLCAELGTETAREGGRLVVEL
jgi:poly-gamma-glutamate capsule biosynthesis protein CapA/YwtB (metallophosphatase superfamily)